jgi:outer membrane biosynthesis protein TonB
MNDRHQRFQAWLAAGAEGDPPRDVAVHASVCDTCRRSIAALDRLAAVDFGRAPMPVALALGGKEFAGAARLASVAAAALVGAAILGSGVTQLFGTPRADGPVAQASDTPDQGVLGETATPRANASGAPVSPGESIDSTATASATTQPVGGPTAKPGSPTRPSPTPRATTPGATPAPTVPPTAPPTPTRTVTPSPSPSPTPTPSPSPTPTPSPSPTPTPSPSSTPI